jgi:hypothetical protein
MSHLSPWRDSEAKGLLQQDILSGAVPAEMSHKDVYNSRPCYQCYPFKNFVTNLKNLRKLLAQGQTAGAPPQWKTSQAKEQLQSDILSGTVRPDMQPKHVYNMHAELYHVYEFRNFSTNLKNLREAIANDQARMIEDAGYYGHDVAIVHGSGFRSEPGYLPWHGSPAATLLAQDVADGKHNILEPMELYASRPEYQIFPIVVFRKRLKGLTNKLPGSIGSNRRTQRRRSNERRTPVVSTNDSCIRRWQARSCWWSRGHAAVVTRSTTYLLTTPSTPYS